MALIKCKECGKEISDKAKSCNGCGCPTKENKDINWKKIFTILLLLVVIYISSLNNNQYSDDSYILTYYDVLIATVIMIAFPAIIRLKNNKPFTYKQGTNICKYNSIILFIVSVIFDAIWKLGFIGGIGAIFYYWINMLITTEERK